MKLRIALFTASIATVSGAAYAQSETWSNPNEWYGQGAYARAGDFDADGRTDIASFSGYGGGLFTSDGYSAFVGSWAPGHSYICGLYDHGNAEWVRVGNFDGDAGDEYVSPSGGTAYVFNYTPWWQQPYSHRSCPSQSTESINSSWGNSQFTWAGDFNGDGYDDIASQYFANVYMKFGNANLYSSGFGSATWGISGSWGQAAYTKVGDFNGDGYHDIASMAGGNAYMKLSTGSGFSAVTWSISNKWFQGAYTFAGDFNADGLDDIASCGGGTCYIKQSTGSGFIDPGDVSIDSNWGNPEWTFVGDFEGDGNDDIVSNYYGLSYMKLVSP